MPLVERLCVFRLKREICERLCRGCSYPLGGVTIISTLTSNAIIPMIQHYTYSVRPNWAALSVRWMVLVVVMLGTIISSIGGTSSHGLAAFATTFHSSSAPSDTSYERFHEHAHADVGVELVDQNAGADYPHHHGSDHSHDKAHALPVAWHSGAPQLPDRFGLVWPWIEMVQASRLERPPID